MVPLVDGIAALFEREAHAHARSYKTSSLLIKALAASPEAAQQLLLGAADTAAKASDLTLWRHLRPVLSTALLDHDLQGTASPGQDTLTAQQR